MDGRMGGGSNRRWLSTRFLCGLGITLVLRKRVGLSSGGAGLGLLRLWLWAMVGCCLLHFRVYQLLDAWTCFLGEPWAAWSMKSSLLFLHPCSPPLFFCRMLYLFLLLPSDFFSSSLLLLLPLICFLYLLSLCLFPSTFSCLCIAYFLLGS